MKNFSWKEAPKKSFSIQDIHKRDKFTLTTCKSKYICKKILDSFNGIFLLGSQKYYLQIIKHGQKRLKMALIIISIGFKPRLKVYISNILPVCQSIRIG